MQMSLKKIAEVTGGKCTNCTEMSVTSVTTDTREITQGALFVALKGDKFDGHEYATAAVKSGAVAVLSQREADSYGEKIPLVCVKNTYEALLDLATFYRGSLDLSVVGVTGSVGKTTTKDMIASVLSQGMQTVKTQGNLNNHIGVPITVFSIGENDSAAVIEMGMNHSGEISVLSRVVRPDIAVITCIGVSHMENLGSREKILEAKLEILEGMKKDAPVIINADNDMLGALGALGSHPVIRTSASGGKAQIRAENIVDGTEGSRFDIYVGDNFFTGVFLPAVGRHNIENALLAAAVGIEEGLSEMQIAAGLAAYVPSGMRQKITRLGEITFIEDCYNASPTSMKASLSTLSTVAQEHRKVAVLGDMLELGDISEKSHYEVGVVAAECCDEVVCCGKLAEKIVEGAACGGCEARLFGSLSKTADYLVKSLKKGDCVLFKASHSMKFEEIISAVYAALDTNKKGE